MPLVPFAHGVDFQDFELQLLEGLVCVKLDLVELPRLRMATPTNLQDLHPFDAIRRPDHAVDRGRGLPVPRPELDAFHAHGAVQRQVQRLRAFAAQAVSAVAVAVQAQFL